MNELINETALSKGVSACKTSELESLNAFSEVETWDG